MNQTARLSAISLTTAVAVVLPLWFAFSVLSPHVTDRLQRLPTWASVLVGVSMLAAVLTGPAVVWVRVVASLIGVDWRRLLATTLRTALPLAVVVGLAVDLSQLFIDTVRPWHDLAVHVLFAIAFATGLSIFFGTLTARLRHRLQRGATAPKSEPGPVPIVVVATTIGVALGALLALPLGWEVRGGMGMRMLAPLNLVLVTGSAAGGAALGNALLAFRPQTTREDPSIEHTDRQPASR